MATRNTREAAEELQIRISERHPGRRIVIVESSKIMAVGRVLAEEHGLEIIKDENPEALQVKARVVAFDVLEQRSCNCGNVIYTAAIGEDSLDECRTCADNRQRRQAADNRQRQKDSARRVAAAEAYDRDWG